MAKSQSKSARARSTESADRQTKGKQRRGRGSSRRRVSLGQIVSASGPDHPAVPAPHISHEEIARRAYLKFLARGCTHGYHEQDWYEAEQELQAELIQRS